MRIQLCGPLVVELDERRVEGALPSRQGRLLFSYLALNAERSVRREELIDCLWPERPPADPSAALNTLVSRLRRAVGAGVVEGTGELRLVLPPGAEIDVRVAAEALRRAQAAASDGVWQRAWGPTHAALAIARRGLLPGVEASWVDRHRRELEDLEFAALELVAAIGLGLGGAELAAADRASAELVERAPFRESGYRLRMDVLAARGNVAEALRTYEQLRRLLAEELGSTPSPELVTLHARLLRGEPVAGNKIAPPRRSPSRAGSAAFVGRSRELDELDRALGNAQSGSRRLVLLSGEPGIGKTRLAQEVAARAEAAGAAVFWGRCSEGDGAPPFWPWTEVLRAMSDRMRPEQLRRALGAGAGDLAQLGPELAELVPGPAAPQPLDPEAARFRLYDSLSRFLARLAAIQPLVFVFDDLHWADAPSLGAVGFLAGRLDEAAILVIGTYRDADVGAPLAELLADLAREPLVSRLELTGLKEGELSDLIEDATGVPPGQPVVAALHRRTEGNPFFASEIVRLLQSESSGDLRSGETARLLQHKMPAGVRDVLRRRLGKLPEQSLDVLSCAAVIGERFELPLLAQVSALDEERVLDLLDAPARAGIVSASPQGPGSYGFSHALIRETLYAELSAARRPRLHLQVGEALERLAKLDPDKVSELAYHFYLGTAVRPDAVATTIGYAIRAADRAYTRLAFEQAEQQLRQALELVTRLPAGPERQEHELEAQVRLGALLMMTKGYAATEVGEACARAQELCETIDNEPLLLSSSWRLGVYHEVRADFAEARRIGEHLLERGRETNRPNFRLVGSQLAGVAALHCGEVPAASTLLEETLALAGASTDTTLPELLGHDFRITSRAFLGWALTMREEDQHAQRLLTEALSHARRRRRPFDEAFVLFLTALAAVIRRDVTAARESARRAQTTSTTNGFPLFAALAGVILGWALSEQDQAELGIPTIEQNLNRLDATGARMMRDCFIGLLAEAYRNAGRIDDALATVEQALAQADTGPFYEAELHRLHGELLVAVQPTRTADAEAPAPRATARAEASREEVQATRHRQPRTLERWQPALKSMEHLWSRAVATGRNWSQPVARFESVIGLH
jgi:DNA-binding SARP family transcriptional activator/tetratricopeptide (TPR) repeat protein